MTPASYIAGIHENDSNITISYSLENWRPNTTWISIGTSGWFTSEGLQTPRRMVPFINLNIWSQSMISVDEIENSPVSLYPNPSSGNFTINFPVSGEYKLTVSDIQGKIIYQNKIQGNKNELIQSSEWSNGLYITRVESAGKNYFSKIIINH
jgi:hypothetical protein